MSGLARRRTAGFGVFLLMLSVLAFTMSGAAAAKDNPGGTHRPPEGCVKLEEEGGTPRVGVGGAVVVGGVTVEFTWIPKPGEHGEWIGFDWVATGGEAEGTVKASTSVFTWGPSTAGTFMVPEVEGKLHAISYVIICTEPEVPPTEPTVPPTEPPTQPTTPQTITLPPQGSTVPATQPTVTIAPQQVTTTAAPTTTTTVGTLPYTGLGSSNLALIGLAMAAAGASLLTVASARREVEPIR